LINNLILGGIEMKKPIFLILIAVVFFILSGCGSSNERASAPEKEPKKIEESKQQKNNGKEAFENYLATITPILQEIGDWAQKYEDLRTKSANGQITNEEFVEVISNELLPRGNEIQEKMESVLPEKEFRDIHEKMNNMLAKNNQAFTEIIAAVNSGDASKITSANNLLAEARELERQAYYDLQDLANQYGVQFGVQ
jgi:hypothetical protein